MSYGAGYALEVALGEGVTLASVLLTLGAINLGSKVHINSQITLEAVFLILLIRKVISYVSSGITCYFQLNVLFGGVSEVFNVKTISKANYVKFDSN